MKKLILIALCAICVQVNAQSFSMTYSEKMKFDTITKQYDFEKKINAHILIDYNANKIVMDSDSILNFFDIISNSKVNEDVFYDCTDKNGKLYKLSMLTTSRHYILVVDNGKIITSYGKIK